MKHLLLIFLFFFTLQAYGQSRYTKAKQLYEDALESYKEGALGEAEYLIEESLYLNATGRSHYLSGLIYEALKKDIKAISAYEATLKYDPGHHEAIFQKAILYLNHGELRKAVEDFTFLLENESPVTRGVYFQIDPSGNSQNQVLSLASITAQLHHYRGQAYTKQKEYSKALDDFDAAVRADTVVDYLISRALLYAELGDHDPAVEDLRKALEVEPDNQLVWYNLVLLNPEIEIPDSLLLEAEFAPVLSLMGVRALDEGRLDQAMHYLDLYLENSEIDDALAYINRGRARLKVKDYAGARRDFEKARKIDPSRAETLYLTGNTYFYQKQYKSALAFYNQYLSIDPTDAHVWYNGAMSYLEIDNTDEACHFLKNAKNYGMDSADEMIDRYCN